MRPQSKALSWRALRATVADSRTFQQDLDPLGRVLIMSSALLPKNPSAMEAPIQFIPRNEREALQWLIPALDRPLSDMPHAEFMRAWSSIAYLYGGLHPDAATDHGEEISYEDDGPDRFRMIEPRLISPFYVESGWPLVLAPLAAEAWRREDLGMLADDELYCVDAQWTGIEHRRFGDQTGLVSTPLKS